MLCFKIINTLLMLIFSSALVQGEIPRQEIVKKVETYYNGINFLKTDFVQTNPDNTTLKGTLWLKRGEKQRGKMLIDYTPNVHQKLLAIDDKFIIYNLKENTKEVYELEQTPAGFLLRHPINLERQANIESISQGKQHITVIISPKGDFTGQSLTLIFSLYDNGNIKGLDQWIVQDINQQQTLVKFIQSTLSINNPSEVSDGIFTAKSTP